MSEYERQAVLFYRQSANDLNDAKKYLHKKQGEKCVLLCVQAAMNRLNSICVSFNRYHNPTYNLTDMLKLCKQKHGDFNALNDECEFMDGIQDFRLFDEHAKGGKRITQTIMKHYYKSSLRVLSVTCGLIHKHNLFNPDTSLFERGIFFLKHRSYGI